MINDIVKGGLPLQAPVRESAAVPAAVSAPAPAKEAAAVEAEEQAAVTQPQDKQQLSAAVSKLNDYVQNMSRTLSFSIAESTGRTIITVYDAETKEMIRQIPPEETLKLAELIEQQPDSLLISDRV